MTRVGHPLSREEVVAACEALATKDEARAAKAKAEREKEDTSDEEQEEGNGEGIVRRQQRAPAVDLGAFRCVWRMRYMTCWLWDSDDDRCGGPT